MIVFTLVINSSFFGIYLSFLAIRLRIFLLYIQDYISTFIIQSNSQKTFLKVHCKLA